MKVQQMQMKLKVLTEYTTDLSNLGAYRKLLMESRKDLFKIL